MNDDAYNNHFVDLDDPANQIYPNSNMSYLRMDKPSNSLFNDPNSVSIHDNNQIYSDNVMSHLKFDSSPVSSFDLSPTVDLDVIGKGVDSKILELGQNSAILATERLTSMASASMKSITDTLDTIGANRVDLSKLLPDINSSRYVMPSIPAVEADEYIPSYPNKVELTEKEHGLIEESVQRALLKMGLDSETISEKVVEKLHYKGVDIRIEYSHGSLTINNTKIPITGKKELIICDVIFVSPIRYSPWSWDEIVIESGDDPDLYSNHDFWPTFYRIRDKIASNTPYKDFIVPTRQNIRINPRPELIT